MGAVTHSNLDDVFSYHKPKGDFQVEKYHRIRVAAKECAKVILDDPAVEAREAALEKFREFVMAETGECRDQSEALGLLAAAGSFVRGLGAAVRGEDAGDPEAQAEITQSVIACIRSAVMWANASVALEGKI